MSGAKNAPFAKRIGGKAEGRVTPFLIKTGAGFGLVPERTALRNRLEGKILAVFERYGYSEIALPLYEYRSVLKDTGHFREDTHITFSDRSTGKLVSLRADFTPQVSRLVAGYRDTFPAPIRICYRGPVFRNVNMEHGAKAEKYHIGCELYGASEEAADRELLLCLNSALKNLSGSFKVILADAAYLGRVFEILGERKGRYRELLAKKQPAGEEFAPLPPKLKELISFLPLSFGDAAALEKLRELSSFDEPLSERLAYLISLMKDLRGFGVVPLFDAAELSGFDYYTGVSFEVVEAGTGLVVGGGGRYDTLMRSMGIDYSACGMSLYLSEIEGFEKEDAPQTYFDYIVLGAERNAFETAERLRGEGKKTLHLFTKEELANFLPLVKAGEIIKM